MSVVAVVPARGGSKGIPQKNLALCGGRSLLDWTAGAARESGVVDRALLSTDDAAIAESGRQLGLEVPFLRPPELASDEAPMLGVLQHALKVLRTDGEDVEAIILLQPTSPFRRGHHIRAAIDEFRRREADTLVSVVRTPHRFVPEAQMREENGRLVPYMGGEIGKTRRQEKATTFGRNGPVILIMRPAVLDVGRLYGDFTIGYEMSELESLDIDTPEELRLADHLLKTGYLN